MPTLYSGTLLHASDISQEQEMKPSEVRSATWVLPGNGHLPTDVGS
jgi:hypothetical protein